MAQKRRALTLDLNAASSKKAKLAASHILTSPDVQKLKLSSPELADLLTRNPTLATPTPSGLSYMFPKNVTEEQETYVKGFEDALKSYQQQNTVKSENSHTAIETIERATAALNYRHTVLPGSSSKMASLANSSTNKIAGSASEVSPRPGSSASGSMDSGELHIKEEIDEDDLDDYDDDDFSEEETKPPTTKKGRGGRKVTPINMESQEKIKLERKRLRNRVAASKCRKRKLERIAQLEIKVKDLKGENNELANVVKKLKESVYSLKQEVIEHVNNGCQISMVTDEVGFSTS